MRHLTALLAAVILASAMLATGCGSGETTTSSVPPLQGGPQAVMVELGQADFDANPHITREIELVRPASLIVSLETGSYASLIWNEEAEISSPVVAQVSHALATPVPDETANVSPPDRDVWVFDSLQAGDGMVRFVYGEAGTDTGVRWTLTVYLTVK